MLYPCGIHFLISQIVAGVAMAVILYVAGGTKADFTSHGILLTGLAAILTMPFCIYFYKKDYNARVIGGVVPEGTKRRLKTGEIILLLFLGAALSVFANMLVVMFQNILNVQAYQENMEQLMQGKSYLMLIFWMGIAAPLAEEMVFRWLIYLRLRDYMGITVAAVISGVFFGIYHMNLVQAVYAGILGIVFAWILEITGNLWSSVLLHMGANIWSLVVPGFLLKMSEKNQVVSAMVMEIILLFVFSMGIGYFRKNAVKNRMV